MHIIISFYKIYKNMYFFLFLYRVDFKLRARFAIGNYSLIIIEIEERLRLFI